MENNLPTPASLERLYRLSGYTCKDREGNTENVKQSYFDSVLPKLWARLFVQEDDITFTQACEILTDVIMEVTSPNYFTKRAAARPSALEQLTAYCDFRNNNPAG
jgi:hypothetical protein